MVLGIYAATTLGQQDQGTVQEIFENIRVGDFADNGSCILE